ncbi:MAG: hypothetical protein LOX97_08675 [Sphingomonas sp.]|nr:hypothetical protein [Sphingomonas sp.]
MPRLKVFCTTSGFYDSLVAAPSRKAALEAWGAKTDLFSMGAAGLVTDSKLAEKALKRPGEVIRFKRTGTGQREEAPPANRKRTSRAKRPSRARLEAAELALAKLGEACSRETAAIERELEKLKDRRDKLEARRARKRKAAEQKVERAREAYETALARWDE